MEQHLRTKDILLTKSADGVAWRRTGLCLLHGIESYIPFRYHRLQVTSSFFELHDYTTPRVLQSQDLRLERLDALLFLLMKMRKLHSRRESRISIGERSNRRRGRRFVLWRGKGQEKLLRDGVQMVERTEQEGCHRICLPRATGWTPLCRMGQTH